MPKIILEKEKCIGCGSCETLCPAHWKLTGDGKVELIGSKQVSGTDNFEKEVKGLGCNQAAADSCPVKCIKIKN